MNNKFVHILIIFVLITVTFFVAKIYIKNYLLILCMGLFTIGVWGIIINDNLFKKLICLNIVQNSVLLFYISFAKFAHTIPPLLVEDNMSEVSYTNPLPHVLMLTAIVVSFATMSVGISLILVIRKKHGTISYRELSQKISYKD